MSNQSEALNWLRSKNFDLAQQMQEDSIVNANDFVRDFSLVILILKGESDKIPVGSKIDAQLMAQFLAVNDGERGEIIAEIEGEINLLNEFLRMLKSAPKNITKRAVKVLTESEIRYAETEGVPPLEFLNRKYRNCQ
jgi:hypothetical protein